jgi:hypothetical protein
MKVNVYESPSVSSCGPKHQQLSCSLPPLSLFTSASSLFTTPRTPYSLRNWKVPSDSPTNPIGHTWQLTMSTTLPHPSLYAKHLPLHFQLIQLDGDGRSHTNKDGIYRVVQVPLTYTLSHLQKLIKFVFQPVKESEMGGSYHFQHTAQHASIPLEITESRHRSCNPFGLTPLQPMHSPSTDVPRSLSEASDESTPVPPPPFQLAIHSSGAPC